MVAPHNKPAGKELDMLLAQSGMYLKETYDIIEDEEMSLKEWFEEFDNILWFLMVNFDPETVMVFVKGCISYFELRVVPCKIEKLAGHSYSSRRKNIGGN